MNERDYESAVSRECDIEYKRMRIELRSKIWSAKKKSRKELCNDLERNVWDVAYIIVCNKFKKVKRTTFDIK